MPIACVCNPIFINTSVVFVRLYWFEKRFENVVLESRMKGRRIRTLSKTDREPMVDSKRDERPPPQGVGTREIRVMRGSRGHAHGGIIENEFAFNDGQDRTGNGIRLRRRSSIEESDRLSFDRPAPLRQTATDMAGTDIIRTFAQQQERLFTPVGPPVDGLPQASKKRSIAFTEAQQNLTIRSTLRIPGPRDFERGHVPEKVWQSDENLNRILSEVSCEYSPSQERSNSVSIGGRNREAHPFQHHVTIDAPDRLRPTAQVSVYNRTRTAEADTSVPATRSPLRTTSRSGTFTSFFTRTEGEGSDRIPYLGWTPTIGRNSNFVDLTEEQREELGGIEYRALKLLAIILVCFFVGFHLLGMICLTPWINGTARYRAVIEDVGINPTWWGFFTAASLFNDLGFTLTPNSMTSFQQAAFPLVLGTFLIVIGNTGFPCMLRFIIWAISKCVPETSAVWEELRFLLDHPRRCFTLLFPSKANWWLFWILILLNGVDLMFFIVLDVGPQYCRAFHWRC
jgi:hypothetical protein